MSITRTVGALFLGAALIVLLLTTDAGAHKAATYFPNPWVDTSQTWHMTDEVPSGAGHRQRIVDAVAAWSHSDRVTWTRGEDIAGNFDPMNPCDRNRRNGVFFRDIDGPRSVLGLTVTCHWVSDNTLAHVELIFDASEQWHTASTAPTKPAVNVNDMVCLDILKERDCAFDLQSVATHEWGHATGFSGPYENGHFDPNAAICDPDNAHKETMCPFIGTFDSSGRTLEDHEWHTYGYTY